MAARTDLALESRDSLGAGALPGVQSRKTIVGGLEVHDIRVLDGRGAEALGKPPGRYLTLLLPSGQGEGRERLFACARALGALVRPMVPETGPVLVWGLGNRAVTPDALGPQALDHLIVTRHLTALFPEDFAEMRPVSALAPGVLGQTGVESRELLRAVMERVQPAAVIAVDALAARAPERLCRTVQLSGAGIVPGSGACNPRQALSRETLGVPVLALGVPTVMEAAALAPEDAPIPPGLLVTPNDIDAQVSRAARIVGFGLNLALQGDMSAGEMEEYLC